MFVEFQLAQIAKWLLEPKVYLLVLGFSLASAWLGVERLDRRYWLHTATDYVYGVMYAVLYFPLIAIALAAIKVATDIWMPWINLGLADHLPMALAFLFVVLVDDFLSYLSHVLRHKLRWLWYFHVIHHSQERLNPLTTKRFHPLENLFDKVAIKWIPLAMLGSSLEMWLMFYAIDAAWDYFIHSNLRVNLGPLRHLIVTPQYHRVHHSRLPQHFDKNFSDRLVIWDRVFGTAYLAEDEYPPTGVPDIDLPLERSWAPHGVLALHLRHLLWPFRQIARDLATRDERPPA